jgi:diadenosine tetraphosphate (Ap4A) HIT family hydrolase
MAQEPLMNISNARTDLQIENMKKIEAEGFCPFCPENIKKYHTPPILRTGTHWYVTPNMYPYNHTKHHFLFITTAHITDTKDLTPDAWAELGEHVNWIIQEHGIPNGTLLMRSGDMIKTGATVLHLHAQFIVGESKDTPVMARVG